MPKQERFSTKYPGVYYILAKAIGSNKEEKIFYLRFKKDGQTYEEKAGRSISDGMTPAKAANIRAERIQGKKESKKELRAKVQWTIDKLWQDYLDYSPHIKDKTTEISRYNKYLINQFGHKTPDQITPAHLDKFKHKHLQNRSPQTVKHAMALLRRIVRHGNKKGYCQDLPFSPSYPKFNNKKTEDLTHEELTRLLKAIDEEDDIHIKDAMKLVLYTGMRHGEILALKWEHIDLDRGFIHLIEPKGGTDKIIPINKGAQDILENHPKISDYVFPYPDGSKRNTMRRGINRVKKNANLPEGFRPMHGLRHFYASMLASSGQVEIYHLQRLLTHNSPTMTQRYSHLRDESLKKAAGVADEILSEMNGDNNADEESK